MSLITRSPFYPIYERHKLFALDFVYLIARTYGTNWQPRATFIDLLFLSPMTPDMEDGARAFLRNREQLFTEKYEALVPPGTSGNIGGIFYAHAVQAFQLFFANVGTPIVFFYVMAYVARLGILFYQRGVLEAPDHAAAIIATFLWHFMQIVGPGVYHMFHVIGRDLVRLS